MDHLTPKELRKRASEYLAAAELAQGLDTRAMLVRLAASYEDMAVKLEMVAAPPGRWHAAKEEGQNKK